VRARLEHERLTPREPPFDGGAARGGRLLAAEDALLSIRPGWHLESLSCFRQTRELRTWTQVGPNERLAIS